MVSLKTRSRQIRFFVSYPEFKNLKMKILELFSKILDFFLQKFRLFWKHLENYDSKFPRRGQIMLPGGVYI